MWVLVWVWSSGYADKEKKKNKQMFLGHFFFPAFHEDKSIGSTQRKGKKMLIWVWNRQSEQRVNIRLFLFWLDNIWCVRKMVIPAVLQFCVCVCVWVCVCVSRDDRWEVCINIWTKRSGISFCWGHAVFFLRVWEAEQKCIACATPRCNEITS